MIGKYSHCGYHIPAQMKICRLEYEHRGDHEFVADESYDGRTITQMLRIDRMLEGRGKYPGDD
jgi:hypothetical protein